MGKAANPSPHGLLQKLSRQRILLTVAGLVLLVLYGAWWAYSISQDRLVGGKRTWLPVYDFLGVDFLGPYQATRHWLAGGNPYQEPFDDPISRPHIYPPAAFAVFAWSWFFAPRTALVIWMAALVAMAASGTIAAWRTRRALGLWPVPLPFALAAVCFSTPVLFAVERGNSDLVVLVLLIAAAGALQRRSAGQDLLAGGCLAFATWVKLYPGLLLLALPALRRWRAAACFGLALVVIGLADVPDLYRSSQSMQAYVGKQLDLCHPAAHPLGVFWKQSWEGTRFDRLARLPATATAIALVLPLALGVSYGLFRCPNASAVLYPYLLWLTALATFIPPIANDYNLFFLPLAALAVWDRRDPLIIHLMMALLLLWWQPLQLAIGPVLLTGFKLAGLVAVAGCLLNRAREQAAESSAGIHQARSAPLAQLSAAQR